MDSKKTAEQLADKFRNVAHLYLGITRMEFNRRLASGSIDFQILKSQIEQNSLETKLAAACENKMIQKSTEQIDKFDYLDDSPL